MTIKTFPVKCPHCKGIVNFTHIDEKRYECPECLEFIIVESVFTDEEMAAPF